jgi:hypothetical protein
MIESELNALRTAILTICDPGANWDYGWNMICELAGLEPTKCRPPFKHRAIEEVIKLAHNPNLPPHNLANPPKPAGPAPDRPV